MSEAQPDQPGGEQRAPEEAGGTPPAAPAPAATPAPPMPDYKGQPLDAERGPGLGCFWLQVVVLAILLVVTPLSVVWGAEPWLSATLLILVLILLLFVGQTAIFLLRLVAADRRSHRRPLRSGARKTVGMLEQEQADFAGQKKDSQPEEDR